MTITPNTNLPKTPSDTLSVMSYNVWVGGQSPARNARVLTMIKTYRPDVLGVQEACPAWRETLTNGLSDYACVGEGRDGGAKGEANPIFYRKDAFTLLDSGTRWLSDTPDRVSKYDESSLNRILTYAVLRRNSDGKVFVHVNTHYDHTNDLAREKQSKALVGIIKTLPQAELTVLTGDFNTEPNTPAYRTVLGAGFTDASAAAIEKAESPTFHGNGTAALFIDFCFLSTERFPVIKYRVCTETIDGDYASDHHPVYTEIRF